MSAPNPLNNALLRSDLWRVLALVFSAPDETSLNVVRGLCADLITDAQADALPFREGLAELALSLQAVDPVALEHEHNALFSMDVMVPAYEGSYQRIERGSVVGDIAGYYRAFGLDTTDHSGPPDSLWNELAFLCWLSLKEAYAIENDLSEALEVTRAATAEFLQDHLGRWTGAFCTRLLHTTGNPLYVTASHLLLATVSLAADELGVEEIRPLEVRELPVEPDAVACPMACPDLSGRVQARSLSDAD